MNIKNALEQIKEDGEIKEKNSLIVKQKFNNLFVNSRKHLEEVRAGLHASSIIAGDSDFCYRAQVLSLIYQQDQGQELPIRLLQIFAAGNSIHEKWQTLFEINSDSLPGFRLVRNEARSFDERYELYFTPDSIIEINGEEYVVEIKSMNTFAYQHAAKSSNPHPSARKQLQLYMYLLGIRNGIILIEDKNTQEFEVFRIEHNHHEVLPFIDRLNVVQIMKKEALENGIFPKRICRNSTTKRAIGCNVCSACFDTGMGRIEI